MSKLLVTLNLAAAIPIIGWGLHQYLGPVIAEKLYASEYKTLMFRCDLVMREHFLAKQLVIETPNDQTVRNLESAEVGLTACHDYDKMRKKLLNWGMSEHQLSNVGLEAIEQKSTDIRKFIEIHEIRY